MWFLFYFHSSVAISCYCFHVQCGLSLWLTNVFADQWGLFCCWPQSFMELFFYHTFFPLKPGIWMVHTGCAFFSDQCAFFYYWQISLYNSSALFLPPWQRRLVFSSVGICLFVCEQYYSKSYERIAMKSYGGAQDGKRKNWLNSGDNLGLLR